MKAKYTSMVAMVVCISPVLYGQTTPKELPLDAGEKMDFAFKQTVQPKIFFESAFYAGVNQWRGRDPTYGQGTEAYGIRLGVSYGDLAISHVMREGVFPVMLHQDPRYFRKGPEYGFGSRVVYALSRVVITRGDNGASQFNYSGILGEAATVGINRAYHPDYRSAQNAIDSLGSSLAIHAGALVLKEFWPDIHNKFLHRSHTGP